MPKRWGLCPDNRDPMCGRYDNLIPRDAYRQIFRPSRLPHLQGTWGVFWAGHDEDVARLTRFP